MLCFKSMFYPLQNKLSNCDKKRTLDLHCFWTWFETLALLRSIDCLLGLTNIMLDIGDSHWGIGGEVEGVKVTRISIMCGVRGWEVSLSLLLLLLLLLLSLLYYYYYYYYCYYYHYYYCYYYYYYHYH